MKPLDKKKWVPEPEPGWQEQVARLVEELRDRKICLLTGAGCSTESGIPDYRGAGTRQRARNPIQFRKFLEEPAGRQRYWARSLMGWPRFRTAEPNRAHLACAKLENAGAVAGIITQNVDRLHSRAGARRVVELHGAMDEVVCLSCARLEARDDLQMRLEEANPEFLHRAHEMAPDGDADLVEGLATEFRVLDCIHCGGILKPRVVFFGEGVPSETVDAAWKIYADADALLVAGSSLAVFSGYRFARQAGKDEKPIYVVNIGASRADDVAKLSVQGNVGAALDAVANSLLGEGAS